MKILRYFSLILTLAFVSSCTMNEVEYDATPLPSDMAEFQLHYFNPVNAVSDNYIYRVEINGQVYANSTAPLSTYNAIPNGAVGRFFTVAPGSVNIKLYLSNKETLVYDRNVTLKKGKQNVFVHDFGKDPIVFDNGYPYSTNTTMDSDSTSYIKFYNFLYETAGVPTTLKLQYQCIDTRTKEVVNLGKPVAFGECTDWTPIRIVKSIYNSSGYSRVDFKIKVVDAAGNITGDLQVWNSNSVYVPYADYWTEYIGRRYLHTISGMRSAKPIPAVRQFTSL